MSAELVLVTDWACRSALGGVTFDANQRIAELEENLRQWDAVIAKLLARIVEPVAHVDETSWRHQEKKHWLWIASSKESASSGTEAGVTYGLRGSKTWFSI